jgi:hypothetical protein
MANILLNLEHGIEVGAADVLRFLSATQNTTSKLEPGAIAALAVVLGTLEKSLAGLNQTASAPLNVTLDVATVNDLRAVWPSLLVFATSLGIKF